MERSNLEPLVDASVMKTVAAGQKAEFLARLKGRHADGAGYQVAVVAAAGRRRRGGGGGGDGLLVVDQRQHLDLRARQVGRLRFAQSLGQLEQLLK